MPDGELHWQQVHWPVPLDAERALGLLHQLAAESLYGRIVWEARGENGQVSHFVGTLSEHRQLVAATIRSLVPGANLSTHVEKRSPAPRVARLQIHPASMRLAVDRQVTTIRATFAALSRAHQPGESVVMQVVLGRSLPPRLTGEVNDPTRTWFEQLASTPRPASSDIARQVRDKRAEPGFDAVVRIGAKGSTDLRRGALIRGVLSALRTLQSPALRIDLIRDNVARFHEANGPRLRPLKLSSSELLALLGWPLGDDALPGMPNAHPRQLPLPHVHAQTQRAFATTTAPGTAHPIGIGAEDALLHTSILGATGSGKSTVLLNLITADVNAGRSVVVIDPKGDLVHDVLARVPAHRRGDVIVLDPTQPLPTGLNPLRAPGTSPELVADRILNVIRDLFPNLFGPRTSDVLHASLLTLARRSDATLTWLPRLLTDSTFRTGLIGNLNDPDGLDPFWGSFNAMSIAQQAQFVGPVLSRLRQFLLRPQLRRVLNQAEPRFNLEEVFSERRILLVPLNTGVLGVDSARLLGSLLVGQLWQLTLARTSTPPEKRHVVSVFIDETHEFLRLGGELADALARSRSLGVAWHLAHQFRDQFAPEVRTAVDANTLNKIVFTLGSKDARDLASMAPELTSEDFMSLDQYEIYSHLVRDGRRIGWVSGRTLPPQSEVSDPLDIIAASQEKYGQPETGQIAPDAPAVEHARIEEPLGRKKRSQP